MARRQAMCVSGVAETIQVEADSRFLSARENFIGVPGARDIYDALPYDRI